MLIAFDFDGTLSDSEMTVLLGGEQGVADALADITERAMNDELSYAESLRSRAELLRGLSEREAERAFGRVALRPGAAAVIDALRDAGHTVAVLTGGFERGVARALDDARTDVDAVVANRLAALADEVGVGMADTVAVGDGANDLPMLEVAGLAVGYEPKPAVEPHCDVVVEAMAELRELLEERGVL